MDEGSAGLGSCGMSQIASSLRKRNKQRLSCSLPLGGILVSDVLAFSGGATIQLSMIWWVLEVYGSPVLLSALSICMFGPLIVGVTISGLIVGRFGARRLLILSKAAASLGSIACAGILASGLMSIEILLALAVLTYGAIAPSLTADLSRVAAFAQFAGWRLATFHTASLGVLVSARLVGFALAGILVDRIGEAATVGLASVLLIASLVVTIVSFPRDRPVRGAAISVSAWNSLTRRILASEAFRRVGILTVTSAALLIAVGLAMIEVIVPSVAHVGQYSSTVLSVALSACAFANIVGAALYRLTEGRLSIARAWFTLPWLLSLALATAAFDGRLVLVVSATAVCAAAGAYLATGLVSTLQKQISNSLQAQFFGLWQTLVMSTAVLVIALVGVASSLSLWLAIWTLVAFALAVALAQTLSAVARRHISSPS